MNEALSVVIITHNEEKNIVRCLKSVQWANEILVIDSGSQDRTCDLAREIGARVISQPWLGFGPQKRFATAQAKHNWVLSLDGDEWLSPELSQSIQDLLASTPQKSAYQVRRRHYFMGKLLRHGISYPDDITRLYHREKANWNENPVHESVQYQGSLSFVKGDLLHESAPSLDRYIAKLNQYTTIQSEQKKTHMIHFLHLILLPCWQFLRGYVFKLGFMDGVPGLCHNVIAAFNCFLRYAKRKERQH
ncbi:MAG: glycosyltransferase family 2 protein [Mariprofundaceae bacterium]|nr:glycosyltransferase family 2 protein [Mariprofundaceae bacterium]